MNGKIENVWMRQNEIEKKYFIIQMEDLSLSYI